MEREFIKTLNQIKNLGESHYFWLTFLETSEKCL